LLPRGRRGARPGGGGAATRRRGARPGPRRAREERALLARPARGDGTRRRGRAAGSLGPRLGRRGDERRVDAAPCRSPPRRAEAGAPAATVLPLAHGGRDGDAGTMVADGAALRTPARPSRARGAAARA